METSTDKWFAELKRIWIGKNIDGVKDLLSTGFEYYENPFGFPLTSWESVRNTWQGIRDQDISTLEIVPLISKDREGMAMYEFVYSDSHGNTHESKGSYFVRLDGQGKAVEFRQWWVAA